MVATRNPPDNLRLAHSKDSTLPATVLLGTVSISRAASTSGSAFQKDVVMTMTKSGIVLALCVLSQTIQGAEPRRPAPSGQFRAVTPTVTVNRTPSDTVNRRSVSVADASKVMAPYKQWMIGANKTGLVYTSVLDGPVDKQYNLKGSAIRKFLQYEKQGTFGGINLGWTDNASARTATESSKWFFTRPYGSYSFVRPIVYGERIAIAWGSKKDPYVKYATRRVGINLDWSKKPAYEWAILGGRPGTDVKRGEEWVIIYNLKHKMPLMYFDRTKGGDIGWPDSTRWGAGSLVLKNNVTMDDAVKALLMPGAWIGG